MSLIYVTCESCQLNYNFEGEYTCECDCGRFFCTEKCGIISNYKPYDENDEDTYTPNRVNKDLSITCAICRHEKFNDFVLFEALMRHYNLTKSQVIEIWKNQKDVKYGEF